MKHVRQKWQLNALYAHGSRYVNHGRQHFHHRLSLTNRDLVLEHISVLKFRQYLRNKTQFPMMLQIKASVKNFASNNKPRNVAHRWLGSIFSHSRNDYGNNIDLFLTVFGTLSGLSIMLKEICRWCSICRKMQKILACLHLYRVNLHSM